MYIILYNSIYIYIYVYILYIYIIYMYIYTCSEFQARGIQFWELVNLPKVFQWPSFADCPVYQLCPSEECLVVHCFPPISIPVLHIFAHFCIFLQEISRGLGIGFGRWTRLRADSLCAARAQNCLGFCGQHGRGVQKPRKSNYYSHL